MRHNYSMGGNHIVLLPMDVNTSEEYRKLRNREDNRSYFFNSAIIEKEQQRKWFESYLNKEDECMFAVFRREDQQFVGGIGIYDIDKVSRRAEVGRIIIDRKLAAGRGYGTEAIRAISRIAYEQLRLYEVYAYIYSTNIASTKAFLKAGFSKFDLENGTVRVDLTLREGVLKR